MSSEASKRTLLQNAIRAGDKSNLSMGYPLGTSRVCGYDTGGTSTLCGPTGPRGIQGDKGMSGPGGKVYIDKGYILDLVTFFFEKDIRFMFILYADWLLLEIEIKKLNKISLKNIIENNRSGPCMASFTIVKDIEINKSQKTGNLYTEKQEEMIPTEIIKSCKSLKDIYETPTCIKFIQGD